MNKYMKLLSLIGVGLVFGELEGGEWSRTGDLTGERCGSEAALLADGRFMVIGAYSGDHTGYEIFDPATGTWTHGALPVTDGGHRMAVLLPNGKVLYFPSGGAWLYEPLTDSWGASAVSLSWTIKSCATLLRDGKVLLMYDGQSCKLYDYATDSDGEWALKPSLSFPRKAHTSTPLPIIHTYNCSTNVLVAGGENSSGFLKSCELYNYSDEIVMNTGDLNVARAYHTAVLLPSGEVLAAGGKNSSGEISSCELHDPSTNTWSFTGNLSSARFDHTATLLKDGRVLAIGGENSTGILSSCEIWDGTNWSATGSLSTGRCLHTALPLQSGKVLVIGGKGSAGNALTSCEIYDPGTGTWNEETSLSQARYLHNATLLYSGLVLVTGGYDGSNYLSSCEIWDPGVRDPITGKHEWKVTATLGSARAYHGSVLIPDLQPYVVSIGGENAGGVLNSIEEYDVGLGYQSDWQSTITNHQSVTHISDTMHIEGTLFRGVSEADGGNHCHIVSNDHPIISLVRIGGGNWQDNGGCAIMYVPLSSSWDESHTDVDLPSDAASGYYRLWSIVNGIPCKWYKPCWEVEERSECKMQAAKCKIYPNPSTIRTGVGFRLSGINSSEKIDLQIYDLSGRLVLSLSREGKATFSWNGKNNEGKKVVVISLAKKKEPQKDTEFHGRAWGGHGAPCSLEKRIFSVFLLSV